MNRPLLGVAVVLVVAVLAAPAMAEPAETSIDGPSEVEPGENVTYAFTLTNTGENESAYLLNTTVPDGWEIVDRNDGGGEWKNSDTQWLWLSVEPGATKETSLTLSVPDNASDGTVEIASRANTSDGEQGSAIKDVTVEQAETSIDGPPEVESGDDVTYTFSATNTGENESGYLLNTTLPDGWEIVDRNDGGGEWKDSDTQWLWLSIEPGVTKDASLTLSVPDNASDRTIEITSQVNTSDGDQYSAAKDVTVEEADSDSESNESENGGGDDGGSDYGGDSGDDGGSDYGGDSGDDGGSGSADDSGDDGGSGSADDSGDDGGSGSEDDSGDDGGSGSADDRSEANTTDGESDSTGAESNTTDGESNTTDGESNTTDGESNTTNRESGNSTGTGGAPAFEPTDESTTDDAPETETDNGTETSDSESGSNTAFAVGLGALMLLAAGGGMVTVRRDVVDESVVETASGVLQTVPETIGRPDTGDGYDGADIEVLKFHKAPDKCILRYATSKTSNKAIGDEIREVARGYASADDDDIGTQRLDATVRHDGQTVATWHIRGEWLEQFQAGELSAAELERRALKTMSLVD